MTTSFEPRFHVDEPNDMAFETAVDSDPAVFTFIEGVAMTWSDTYRVDCSARLSDAQIDLVRHIWWDCFDDFRCTQGAACIGRRDWEPAEQGRHIGGGLAGDADEISTFEPFFVSQKRAVCQDCAWEICRIDEDSFNDQTVWTEFKS